MYYIVTRHQRALEWAKQEKVIPPGEEVKTIDHLTEEMMEGISYHDTVIGAVPVAVDSIERICDKGAYYYHLVMDVPPEARGKELGAEEMRAYHARIERYLVLKWPFLDRRPSRPNAFYRY